MSETVDMRTPRRPVVVVYVRHALSCAHVEDESYPRCSCPKSLRWSIRGKQYRKAAGTRTWSIADEKARELQRRFDAGEEGRVIPGTDKQPTIAHIFPTVDIFGGQGYLR